MCHKKITLLFAVLFVLIVGVFTVNAASLIDQKAALSGKVVSAVQVGTHVEEGTELVRVSTLAGSATAARANAKGIVKEVLVHSGSVIQSGDVVARIAVE